MRVPYLAFFTVLAAAVVAFAAPPVPSSAELSAPVGEPTLLTVTVEAGKKLGTTKTYDPAALMFARLWTEDPNTYEFWVFPKKSGTYYVPLWTEGETVGTVVKVVAGGEVEPDKPTDPEDPVPTPTTRYYFAAVRADGPAAPEFEKWMKLSAWDDVRKAGHYVKDFEVSKLPPGIAKPTALPSMVVMVQNTDGKTFAESSRVPMPTTNEQIKELLK